MYYLLDVFAIFLRIIFHLVTITIVVLSLYFVMFFFKLFVLLALKHFCILLGVRMRAAKIELRTKNGSHEGALMAY